MPEKQSVQFPNQFVWGVSAASYQIEGYPLADGAVPSIWHRFAHTPGKIDNNENGDTACDHYHRYPQDIEHMHRLGVDSYRFSTAWPRIVPEPGKVNQKGVDFYSKLVDELLKKNIEPLCTLFHWDAPVWLFERGGFLNRDSAAYMREYSEVLFRALGDRVKKWVTINEPMVFAMYGYITGEMPPGKKNDVKGMMRTTHHLLLSHAAMVKACREHVQEGKIGIAEAQVHIQPLRKDNPKDRAAADRMDQLINRLYIDPVFRGFYPPFVLEKLEKHLPDGYGDDLKEIKEPGDFVGINYYMTRSYKHTLFAPVVHAREKPTPGLKRSAMWEIFPDGLYLLLKRLKDEYGNPDCYITENGYPLVEQNGPLLEDDERIDYLSRHLEAASRAIKEGVNLKGYYQWSFMDNFEWALGYSMRFGLIRTDFETLERTWKKSAHWYKRVIENNGF